VKRPSGSGRVLSLFGGPDHRALLDLLKAAGANVERSTAVLLEVLRAWPDDDGRRQEIRDLEHEGDRLTHEIIYLLHSEVATPFDRGDLYRLASELDDIVDFTEEVSDVLALYKVEAPTEQAIQLAEILHAGGREVASALAKLDRLDELRPHVIKLNDIEDDGDRVERAALTSLFEGGIDPMVVIRWKDIYERLEEGIDACEHVANVLEGLIVKAS
jgi:uncharacterized protein